MFATPLSQAGAVTMALACLFAIARGGWVERLAAGALMIDWIGCAALQDRRFGHHGQPAIFAIDVVYCTLLFVLAISVTRTRYWLLCACAFQLLIVLTHVMAAADVQIGQWDFFSAYFVWSYALLAALALGAALEGKAQEGRAQEGRALARDGVLPHFAADPPARPGRRRPSHPSAWRPWRRRADV